MDVLQQLVLFQRFLQHSVGARAVRSLDPVGARVPRDRENPDVDALRPHGADDVEAVLARKLQIRDEEVEGPQSRAY